MTLCLYWCAWLLNVCDLIILQCFVACTEHRVRHFSMSHCRQRMSLWALCVSCVLSSTAVWFSVCVCVYMCVFSVCVPASSFPGGGPVGWQSCPVVITLPGAASGTIWPPPLEPHQSRHAGGKPKRRGCFKNSQSWHNKTPQSTETGSTSW